MRIDIITIFPGYFAPLSMSLIGKAAERGDIEFVVHDLRTWARDIHHTVDDTPYGGGPGMVMKPEPWGDALDAVLPPAPASAPTPASVSTPASTPASVPTPTLTPASVSTPASTATLASALTSTAAPTPAPTPVSATASVSASTPASTGVSASAATPTSMVTPSRADSFPAPASSPVATSASVATLSSEAGGEQSVRLIVPSPSGKMFTQDMAAAYAQVSHLVFACGRYEGIDTRVVEEARTRVPVDEVSIGDYVLAGGEPAALVMIEAICRLLPGVLGNADSVVDDSFGAGGGEMAGLLEGPLYTRPRVWRGREVPPVLVSGDHAAIARWRRDAALRRTVANRPDLAARLRSLDVRDRQILDEAAAPHPLDIRDGQVPDEAAAPHPLDTRDRQVPDEAAAPLSPAHHPATPAAPEAGAGVSEPGFPVDTEDMAH